MMLPGFNLSAFAPRGFAFGPGGSRGFAGGNNQMMPRPAMQWRPGASAGAGGLLAVDMPDAQREGLESQMARQRQNADQLGRFSGPLSPAFNSRGMGLR